MKHKNSARMAVLAAAALGIASLTASTSGAAEPRPASPGPVASADDLNSKARFAAHPKRTTGAQAAGRAAYFVRFKGAGAADLARKAGAGSRGSAAAKSRRAEVSRIASGVLSAARGADAKAASIFTVSNAIPGAGLFLDAAGVRAVAANPNVVSVAPMVAKTAEMQSVDSLIKAVNVWKFSGNTGKGVTIGIVDTGVDYTHADFGGRGTIAAFDAADAKDTSPTWWQDLPKKAKKKFAGGYDFSGDNYNGDAEPGDGTSPIPQPDNNPLDCNGHGSHVAGISAGYGVSKSGKTLKAKKYRKLTKKKLMKLDIGPGVAPLAKIYALRVFGCDGSTYLDIPAYDRALDPNGDGKFSDHLDIINASLGSDYGPQDDPGTDVINEIASHGVLPALSIGNNGDLTDTGGAPGNATASIASASSVDRLELLDGIKVNAPASVAGIKPGQMSVAYDWLREPPVTGTVATLTEADNLDGCDPLSPADAARVNGKVAWLEWDDNDATRECGSVGRSGNVKAAGAIGAIFTSELEVFAAGITGDEDIPVFQLTNAGSDQLRPFAQNMTLNVTFDGKLQASVQRVTPSLVDTISDFTSRGPRGSLPGTVVKPDVAAPGQSIGSAGVGSGNRVSVISGTSMASPATAGIAALVKAEHPKWSPLKVKAAIMNTARHDLYTGPGRSGEKYGPARVGAGRVNAKGAVTTKLLAWTKGPNNPVSAGFGVVEAPINGGTVTRTKTVKVKNLNNKTVNVKVKYQGIVSQPGVSYSVKPKKLTIKEGKTKKFKVKMTVVPAQLRHTIDPTMEVDQLGVPRQYVSDASGRLLVKQKGKKANRVPVYGAAKPTSATSTALAGNNLVVSGQGFNTGTGSTDWRSLLSVTEFGGSDEVMPACESGEDPASGCAATHTDRGSDIQHVGAGANDDYLWLAMSTHTDWTNMVLNSPDFLINTDADPAYEYNTFVTIVEATDLYVAVTVDLDPTCDPDTEVCVDFQPVNFNWGDVDTNVFDNNVVVLPVDKAFVGLDGPGSHPIEYDPANWNAVLGEYTDFGPIVEFDAGTPDISTAEPLYLDQGGTTIPLTGARDETKQALILHLHGAEGRRTELVTVPAIP